ncbi:hypothetical protein HWV62_22509 [Athelia sp. TMB]|nr:hypothetical protein HWV62_22509 [Athelia sp. TMB]
MWLAKGSSLAALDKLPYADGASWNPRLACLPGTRVTMLSLIRDWSRLRDNRRIFCLKDVAGSGKTTISNAVAQALIAEGSLASSFFFDRATPSRDTPRLLFSTIARDIASLHPAIAADIAASIEEDPSLASAPLPRQFEAFIAGPLSRHPIDRQIIVVVDALDEDVRDEGNTDLLTILRDEIKKLPPNFRLFLTTRPTMMVERFLSASDHISFHTLDINSPENRQDIAAYVNSMVLDVEIKSRMGPPWPDEALIRKLKEMAEGRFIWITTVFAFLRESHRPRAKLQALLSNSLPEGPDDPIAGIDALYTYILEICGNWNDPDFCKAYAMFMGAIIAVKRPLSLAALRAFHGGNQELLLDRLPQRFGSVLVGLHNEHEPIRMLHLSFREFVTVRAVKSADTRKFFLSEKEHSRKLAELCLQTMVRELTAASIAGVGYLAENDDDRPGIPRLTGLSEQLQYGCESWSDHICDIQSPTIAIAELLREFLPHHHNTSIEVVASTSTFVGTLPAWRWINVHGKKFLRLYGEKSQAETLHELAIRLRYEGRLEEALVASEDSVHLRRVLAQPPAKNRLSNIGKGNVAMIRAPLAMHRRQNVTGEQPETVNPTEQLAHSLSSLSVHLSDLGRHIDALVASQEDVKLRRALSAERPAAFNAVLAQSLDNLSVRLSDHGRHEEALAAIQEAVGRHRALAVERPEAFNDALANSLGNLSNRLSDHGRHEEALAAIQEAVGLRRALAAERPEAFNDALANSLGNLSNHLSDHGRHEEALAAIREAVGLRRALAAERPGAFNAVLAQSINNLSARLSDHGQREEALAAIQEAVGLRRALAAERPAAFNAHLAESLSNLSARLSDHGQREEALAAIQEAVGLRRALAAERPASYNAALAESLSNLSACLSDHGRHEEALAAIQESVGLRRALAAERPASYNAALAESLSNLSVRLSDHSRHEEALAAIQEVVGLRRALAAERPKAFNAALAESLNKLSNRLPNQGRHEEALAALQEAVGLYRALAAERPGSFRAVIAYSLNSLSNRLSELGRHAEALAAIQEAVGLRRALAAEQPEAFNANLARSLNNLSNRLSERGRYEEALAAIQEAVGLRRALAAERPAAFNGKLAGSLYNLSFDLSPFGRHQEALEAAEEAVSLRRALATERPKVFTSDLSDALKRLSQCLSASGREEEAQIILDEARSLSS